ncbi:hypothetical protein HDV01_005880 [Terramyces sp. JEL0728]|nr:hypothetical protein HDV01_005880 [Terramyces sp. JEL0728]
MSQNIETILPGPIGRESECSTQRNRDCELLNSGRFDSMGTLTHQSSSGSGQFIDEMSVSTDQPPNSDNRPQDPRFTIRQQSESSFSDSHCSYQQDISTESSELSEDELESSSVSGQSKRSAQVSTNQTLLRKQILEIQGNQSLSGSEKAKMIQELMSRPWQQKQKQEQKRDSRITNFLVQKSKDFSIVPESDKSETYYSENTLGCKHYQRACKLQAHCCGKWDTCRFCHDEVSDHTITRNLIKTMMCMYCWTVQPAGQICINNECGKAVSAYFCKECKLWDNDPRKNIYHCYDCGICRIGKGLGIDYFHCPTCNVCMAIGLKGKHKCIERNLESDCPICGEYMFTSTSTVIFMPCGHCMHHKCHQQHIHTSYQCPTCLKSLADMSEYFRRIDIALAQHQMPPEYHDTFSHIYCNDCEKKSHAKFHFIYHKCGHCRGYNTKLISTQMGLPADACIAADVVLAQTHESRLDRLESSASIGSASSGASSGEDFVGIWCHHCQVL